MTETLPNKELDPNASWRELEPVLGPQLQAYANLSYPDFLDIDEASRIGVLYALEEFGSEMTFDAFEALLYDKGILDKYLA